MNKTELVDAIAEGSGITKLAAGKALDVLMDAITETLKKGGQVLLPGFCSLSTTDRAARTGRNPQTGQTIEIKASRVVKFKVGKNLKEAVGK